MRTVALSLLVAMPALAQTPLGGDDLRSMIVGNTVEGSMAATGPYAEFYAPDGSIRAADYAGRWSIKGGQMCFDYGDGPAGCWRAVLSGDQVVWIGPEGEEGSGVIRAGNPGGW